MGAVWKPAVLVMVLAVNQQMPAALLCTLPSSGLSGFAGPVVNASLVVACFG